MIVLGFMAAQVCGVLLAAAAVFSSLGANLLTSGCCFLAFGFLMPAFVSPLECVVFGAAGVPLECVEATMFDL